MTRRKPVTVDRVVLRLPPGADAQAVLRAVTDAVAQSTASAERLHVTVPGMAGEGPRALAARIGRATAAQLKSGGGS